MSIKKRRSDTKCAGLSSDKWDELSERLRHTIIVAQDSANSNVEYFIMPGEQLFHSSPQGYDTSEPVGVPASSDNIAKSKTKETYHLIVHKKKGGGGFGVVYQAGMTTAGGQHSIDICLKQARDQSIETLIKENDIFSYLTNYPHDNIIKRLFLCQTPQDMMLGLEYFDGLTLADHIVLTKYYRQRMPTYSLHPIHIVTVLKQQTEAIQHLQICNVFHCDFKPENVLYNEKRRQSKLIDFGMAVFGNRANEIFKSQGGTTEFMAPETLLDGELMVGTDLFGLGAALHHVMTLELPWHSLENIQALNAEILNPNSPNIANLKAQRRSKRRHFIKAEISRYRRLLPPEEEEIEDIENDEPRFLVIQEELMCTESYEFPLKDIICKMLRHNPRLRPECEDILKYIEDNYTGAPAIEHQISEMSMSSQSSRGTLSGDNSIANEANEEQEEMMSAQSANNIPIFLTGSSIQEMHTNSASDRPSALQPNFSMLNKNSSYIDQPSDARQQLAYPSTERMSITQSGMEPTDSAYDDPTGMSAYVAGNQADESSSHFSMPHSDNFSMPHSDNFSMPHSDNFSMPRVVGDGASGSTPLSLNGLRPAGAGPPNLMSKSTSQLSPTAAFKSRIPLEDDNEDDL